MWFITHQNMGKDTKITVLPCVFTEILTKTTFSVMADLICILCELPKDDRVASFRFWKSTSWRYRNIKKTLYILQCKVHQKPDYYCSQGYMQPCFGIGGGELGQHIHLLHYRFVSTSFRAAANESQKTRNKKQNGLAHLQFIVCVTPKQKKHCLIRESSF